MTITYTWKLSNLDVLPTVSLGGVDYTDVVKTVHWRLHGTDGTNEGEVYGSVDLDTTAVDSGSFVEFDSITAETLAQWAQVAINAGEAGAVDKHKAKIAEIIAEQATPTVVNKLPAGFTPEVKAKNRTRRSKKKV
jgi:hypothetical protein